jgi:hypothetical protein
MCVSILSILSYFTREEHVRVVYHIVTQLLYQHVPEKGDNVLKTTSTTFVTHQRPPRYSLLSEDPRREVSLKRVYCVKNR